MSAGLQEILTLIVILSTTTQLEASEYCTNFSCTLCPGSTSTHNSSFVMYLRFNEKDGIQNSTVVIVCTSLKDAHDTLKPEYSKCKDSGRFFKVHRPKLRGQDLQTFFAEQRILELCSGGATHDCHLHIHFGHEEDRIEFHPTHNCSTPASSIMKPGENCSEDGNHLDNNDLCAKANETLDELNEQLKQAQIDTAKTSHVISEMATVQSFNDIQSVRNFTRLLANQLVVKSDANLTVTYEYLLSALGNFASKGLWTQTKLPDETQAKLATVARDLVRAMDDIGQNLVASTEAELKINASGVTLAVIKLQGRSAVVARLDAQTVVKTSTEDNPLSATDSGAVVATLLDLQNLTDRLNADPSKQLASKLVQVSLYSRSNCDKTSRVSKVSVLLQLQHLPNRSVSGVRRSCVHLDSNGSLSESGCKVVPELSNESVTSCICSHLSSFALLVTPGEPSDMWFESQQLLLRHSLSLSILTHGCLGLSILCLLLTCLTYLIVQLGSAQGRVGDSIATMHRVHTCLCVCLLLAHALFLTGFQSGDGMRKVPCQILSSLTLYFFLAAFCWLLCEGFLYTKSLIIVLPKVESAFGKIKFRHFCLLSCFAPFLVLLPVLVFRHEQLIQYQYNFDLDASGSLRKPKVCWLSSEFGTIWAFITPVLLVCLVSLMIFSVIFVKLTRRDLGIEATIANQASAKSDLARFMRRQLKLSLTLASVLGLTSLMCVLFFFTQGTFLLVSHYLFTLLNGMQGCFIFASQIAFNDRVRVGWESRLLRCRCLPSCFLACLERLRENRLGSRGPTAADAAGKKAGTPAEATVKAVPVATWSKDTHGSQLFLTTAENEEEDEPHEEDA